MFVCSGGVWTAWRKTSVGIFLFVFSDSVSAVGVCDASCGDSSVLGHSHRSFDPFFLPVPTESGKKETKEGELTFACHLIKFALFHHLDTSFTDGVHCT